VPQLGAAAPPSRLGFLPKYKKLDRFPAGLANVFILPEIAITDFPHVTVDPELAGVAPTA